MLRTTIIQSPSFRRILPGDINKRAIRLSVIRASPTRASDSSAQDGNSESEASSVLHFTSRYKRCYNKLLNLSSCSALLV